MSVQTVRDGRKVFRGYKMRYTPRTCLHHFREAGVETWPCGSKTLSVFLCVCLKRSPFSWITSLFMGIFRQFLIRQTPLEQGNNSEKNWGQGEQNPPQFFFQKTWLQCVERSFGLHKKNWGQGGKKIIGAKIFFFQKNFTRVCRTVFWTINSPLARFFRQPTWRLSSFKVYYLTSLCKLQRILNT